MESFRAEVLLGRMVRLRNRAENLMCEVLELCCSEWFQNSDYHSFAIVSVLELCCSEWFQNEGIEDDLDVSVLELCCSEWFQNIPSN